MYAPLEESSPISQNFDEEITERASIPDTINPSPIRKRGRPPKYKTLETSITSPEVSNKSTSILQSEENVSENTSNSVVEAQEQNQMVSPSEESIAEVKELTVEENNKSKEPQDIKQIQEQNKKVSGSKRGRPKKLYSTMDSALSTSASPQTTSPADLPRKRGRPPKKKLKKEEAITKEDQRNEEIRSKIANIPAVILLRANSSNASRLFLWPETEADL